jgi:ribosomal protein L23
MVTVDVRDANKALQGIVKILSPEKTARATKMALNDGIRKAKTETKRAITSIYNIKPSRIDDSNRKKGLSVKFATDKKLSTEVDAGHIPLTLSEANPKYKGETVATQLNFSKKGKAKRGKAIRRSTGKISIEIIKGQRKELATAFTIGRATHASGGMQFTTSAIFARGKKDKIKFNFSKPRYPIDSMSTISVATAALNTNAQNKIQPVVNEYVTKRMKHHLTGLVEKII